MLISTEQQIGCPIANFIYNTAATSSIIDAVGESVGLIGYMSLSTGPGSSAVLSAAGGGKIHWLSEGAVTWANVASTLRVGIQGTSLGLEDGVFSAYGDMIPGTHAIVANTLIETLMTSGTVTITDGVLMAIVIEMTAKGGTDSVRPTRLMGGNLPYSTTDIGSGPAKNPGIPLVAITFDNGTIGYFALTGLPYRNVDQVFNSGSAINEYAFIFTLPYDVQIDALVGILGEIDASETGDMILYGNALSADPVVLRSFSPTNLDTGNISSPGRTFGPVSRIVLRAFQPYAVSYRATSTQAREIQLRTTHENFRSLMWPAGCVFYGGTRSGGTGAFTLSNTVIPTLGINTAKIDFPLPAPRTRMIRSL